jgi:hypothetical protein
MVDQTIESKTSLSISLLTKGQVVDWMHDTARCFWYPSDSSRTARKRAWDAALGRESSLITSSRRRAPMPPRRRQLAGSSSPSTALCGPPPGIWPRLGVRGRRVGSSPASSSDSSPLTALCGPQPGIWPRLGVGWRRVGNLPTSSSPSTALCWPQPGIRPGRSLWLGRRIPSPRRSPTAVLPPLPTPFSYYPHPMLYLPSPIPPSTPLPPLGDPSSPSTHSRPLVPSSEENKLCSTVVSTNAI